MPWDFKKFFKGDESLEDEGHSGWPMQVDSDQLPNVVGVEETQLLNTALENAKSVRDANSAERFSGPAYDALVAAITKYEAEGPTYTAPSAYKNAAAALDAAAQAMRDHRTLCGFIFIFCKLFGNS